LKMRISKHLIVKLNATKNSIKFSTQTKNGFEANPKIEFGFDD